MTLAFRPTRREPSVAAGRPPSRRQALLLAGALCVTGCVGPSGEPDPGAGEGGRAEAALPADLQARVTARLDALDAISTLYAKHLPTGREIAVRADRPMNTLSVIKIPVMVQAFLDDRAGRLDLDARYTVSPEDLRRGSGLLQTFDPGLQPTLRGLVRQMIITSDNTATDMVIREVGLDRVNELLSAAGYRETRLRMTTGDLFREVWVRADPANASMSDREVFEAGFPSDPEASARSFALEGDSTVWLGRTTAREMGRLLEQIVDAELADQAASLEMLDMLRGQFYSSRLPQRVRWQGVGVAHKTGDWPPIAGNDVGVLFYAGGPTVVAVFTNQNRGDFFELEATLGLVAEDIVTAWR
jgi:beta-lactamase class A